MRGTRRRAEGPRRTANEEELAGARVDPDHAAPAYDGHAVLQGEALVSEDEEEASLRKLRKRDQPSLVRLVVSLNVGALICAFAYVAFQAPTTSPSAEQRASQSCSPRSCRRCRATSPFGS